jgi:hypothetical protein
MSNGDKYLPRPPSRFRALLHNPVVLWVVLIIAFLAIWRFLNDGSGPAGAGAHKAGGDPGGAPGLGTEALTWIIPMVFCAVMFGWFRLTFSRVRRFNEESAVALKSFAAADYRGAVAKFAELEQRYRSPGYVRTTASYNLAMALMRSGEVERALAYLTALDPTLNRSNPALRPKAAAQIAVIHAFRGEPAVADRWIAEAEARAKKLATPQVNGGATLLARTVNAIRRGEQEAAVRELIAGWDDLEATLVGSELRPFRVLRAFATVRGEGAALGAAATAALADARPGEVDWMGVEWPEMRAFLEAASTGRPRA